jgi:hypothetical protein
MDNSRGVDLVAGSEFINSLDIDKVSRISLTGKNGEELIFERNEDSFTLGNFSNYPVKGPEITDLIYKISSITVKEKVSGKKHSKYGVDKKSATYRMRFFDNKGSEILGVYVGNSYNEVGNYIRREGQEQIYLTEGVFEVPLDKNSFVEKNILDFDKDKVKRLDLGSEVVIEKNNEGWIINGLDKSKYKEEQVDEAVTELSQVQFDNFYPETDTRVSNLSFTRGASIVLNNKMIYKLALARDKDKYFIKAQASLEDITDDIVLNPQGDNESIKEVNDIIKVQSGAQNFNLRFKNWVFEISEIEYNKFIKEKTGFSDEG